MPLGDSISVCCHHCGVAAAILPRHYRTRNAEPNRPWEGYIKQLHRILEHHQGYVPRFKYNRSSSPPSSPTVQFSFEGRVTTCMMNGTKPSLGRVDTDDWSVHYEGYYGITSGGLLTTKLGGALKTLFVSSSSSHASASEITTINVVLLHIGTNDLIQPGLKNRVTNAVGNVASIIRQIREATIRGSSSSAARTVLIVSALSPMQFHLIGGDRLAPQLSKKSHRWKDYNDALHNLVSREDGFLDDTSWRTLRNTTNNGLDVMFVNPNQPLAEDREKEMLASCGSQPKSAGALIKLPPLSREKHLHGDGLHLNFDGERVLATTFFSGMMSYFRITAFLQSPPLNACEIPPSASKAEPDSNQTASPVAARLEERELSMSWEELAAGPAILFLCVVVILLKKIWRKVTTVRRLVRRWH